MLFESPTKQGEKEAAHAADTGVDTTPPLKEKTSELRHVAIIMDGNGRWAQRRGFTRVVGHRNGVGNVRKVVRAAHELGLQALTLFAFSEENWRRPKTEIAVIMSLIDTFILKDGEELAANNIRLQVIGDLSKLPIKTAKLIEDTVKRLSPNTGMILNIALSYSGRTDIVQAARALAAKVAAGEITADQIDESMFAQQLSTSHLPEPDLLIRTSGEQRISNFLLWQFAYTELYFTDVFWPDFGEKDFYQAIEAFKKRDRRFGAVKTSGNDGKNEFANKKEALSH